ncbi:Ovarian cancer-associated protein 2, partial [Chytridiales sp. JEL 0842]
MALPKLRILCLHGYTQNESVFRKRTGVLRKDLTAIADLVYVSAPHLIPPTEEEAKSDAAMLKAFNAQAEDAARAWWIPLPDRSNHVGYPETIEFLKRIWIEQGPFDGILGFSQGAAITALFAAELISASITPPKFLIAISGFASIAPCHNGVLERFEGVGGIPVPSMHVYGNADTWVHAERSKDLMEYFNKDMVVAAEHEGG